MEQKKEIQEKIIEEDNQKATEEEFIAILKLVAPGTNLRMGIDGALKAQKGALIVVENEYIESLLDGGFRINAKFTPQRLIELAKMDGAIVLSKDMKTIEYANVMLTPDSKISTLETGTRHKAGDRTAKQAGTLVIAISERKHEVNIFFKNIKHPLTNTEILLRKANEHIQLLDKQRELFDSNIERLNAFELQNYPSLDQAIQVIQKGYFIQKISEDLKKYIIELGKEGALLKVRLKELMKDVENETDLIIKDYTQLNLKQSIKLLEDLSYDEILDNERLMGVLGHDGTTPVNAPVQGWRLLTKTSLHEAEIAQLINEAGSLGKSIHSNVDFYKKIFGMDKAVTLKEELNKIKLNNFAI